MKNHQLVICVMVWMLLACNPVLEFSAVSPQTPAPTVVVDRATKISSDAVKMSPTLDEHPPRLLSSEFEDPMPVPGGINTAGGEDSPFVIPGGNTLYFFFTPNVTIPAEKQLLDGVTGIYVSQLVEGEWRESVRILLQDPGKLALDGCEFVADDIMWFCSTREGYSGIHWFTVEYQDETWKNWKIADFPPEFKVGELHFARNGTELYFASDRPGGKGQLDVWVSLGENGTWQEPVNVAAINTAESEGWPATNPAGDELWFARSYGIWRSKLVDGVWQPAEQIVADLAGEPSIDAAGNLYFVHHFYRDGIMVEADIYVAYRK